jgi:molybdopterin-containing oxidoreductase family iron-sulfur binding subunit
VWGTWIELNPQTAAEYGIRPGELVRVRSAHAEVQVAAVLVPGIRPDTVAMPIGQGHVAYGRYASRRGANPFTLLGPMFDERSGALATGATRVRLEATGQPATLVLIEQASMATGGGLISIDRTHGEAPI